MSDYQMRFKPLSRELKRAKYEKKWFLTEVHGLQPFLKRPDGTLSEVVFEVCDTDQLYALASYGGFPIRYPHYSWGLDYDEMLNSHAYGLSKIYEMVINNEPCFAYLLQGNSLGDQKLVIAHVYGHADFFVNNAYFANTNRKAIDMMANHSARINQFIDDYGAEVVEEWIDVVRSIDNLIDPNADAIKRTDDKRHSSLDPKEDLEKKWDGRFKASEYMDDFINPPKELDAVKQRLEVEKDKAVEAQKSLLFPVEPVRDVMGFLAAYAPLELWKREVILMLRDEAYYFEPQGRTKILNEGWASYWHSVAMTQLSDESEIVDYADHNSGTLATSPKKLNPYALGKAMFLDIEHRWNTHRWGNIFQECDKVDILDNWDVFVAFFNIYIDCKDDPIGFDLAWREFLYFWHKLEDGAVGIAKGFFEKRFLLLWWSWYLNLSEKLGEAQSNFLRNHLRVTDLSHQLENLGKFNKRVSLGELIEFHTSGLEVESEIETLTKRVTDNPGEFITTQFLSSILSLDRAGCSGELILSDEIIGKTKEKFEERLAFWGESIRPHLEGKVRFFCAFETIKKDFAAGKRAPDEFFVIPDEFFVWAENKSSVGKLEIGVRRDKIFEVRRVHCDLTAMDEFLTMDLAVRTQLFAFEYNSGNDTFEIASRQFEEVKANLLFQLANMRPNIVVVDANYGNKRQLLLEHRNPEMELDMFDAQKTLERVYKIWNRPVYIRTILEDVKVVVGFNGTKHYQEKVDKS